MSDAEGSGSDSDPVSDVNPEEMARLMADLDEMDNDLFKSTLKSGGKSSGGNPDSIRKESKDLSKRVTFREDSSLHSKATKVPQDDDDDDDDDDWDAGDLLLSDDGAVPHEQKNTLSKEDASNISSEKEANSEIKLPVRKDKTESSPLSSTFSPKGGDRDGEGKISAPASVKKSKARLMEDLFGNQDSPEPTTSPGAKEAGKAAGRAGGKIGKVKEEVTFEEDNDLLGDPDLDSKMATNSPKGENFLSAILKSPSAELTKREKRPDFVLDDKYKNLDKVDNSSKPAFGSYMPSTSKPGSPRQSGKQSGSISNRGYDFSPDPGKRISHATPQRKAFELDDDEILGNIRSRRAIKKEVSPEASHRKTRSNRSTPTKSENKGDWLFESTETPTANVKKAVDEESRLTGAAEKDGGYAGEDSDWLSDILAMKKKSVDSRNSNVDVLSSSSRNVKQAATAPDNSELEVGQSETGCAAVVLNTHTKQQQLLFEVSQPQETGMQSILPKENKEMAAKMAAQQKQLEAQMVQQVQQQLLAQAMRNQMEVAEKRHQEHMMTQGEVNATSVSPASVQPQQGNSIEIELRKAEVEAARLKAELDLLRRQHQEEVTIMEEGFRRKQEVEKEVWSCVETRLREERDGLLANFTAKIAALQEEKENLACSYEAQMSSVKAEWAAAMERTKDLYSDMVQRMKEEHSCTLERLTHLKEVEVKAALTSSGHVREAEVVMAQLESNTTELSTLTSLINKRNESALELTHTALKMKEKQLQDLERELSASHAETESERGRLNALINRLETTLVQQGSEVEKERWRLAQERLKIEVERQSLAEERKHLQLSNEIERQNLATSRESMMLEHRTLLQSVAQRKQDLTVQEAKLSVQQRLTTTGPVLKSEKVGALATGSEILLAREEKQIQEKLAALTVQSRQLSEKETKLEEVSLQLEQDRTKVQLERDMVKQEQTAVAKSSLEVDRRQEEMRQQHTEQQNRLAHITMQIRALHSHQEKTDMERHKLQQIREEVMQLVQRGLCVSCQASGRVGRVLSSEWQSPSLRLPGDGGEGRMSTSPQSDMSPSSVLARLAAAQQQHNADQEKRLLQMSALKSL